MQKKKFLNVIFYQVVSLLFREVELYCESAFERFFKVMCGQEVVHMFEYNINAGKPLVILYGMSLNIINRIRSVEGKSIRCKQN